MLVDFLNSTRSPNELLAALEVLRDFRESESYAESKRHSPEAWLMFDVFEDVLANLVDGQPLCQDTAALLRGAMTLS